LRAAIESSSNTSRAHFDVPTYILSPWRAAHVLIGRVTVEGIDAALCVQVVDLANRILDPQHGVTRLREFVIDVCGRSDDGPNTISYWARQRLGNLPI
jgi:hypothetical protein